MSIVSEEVREDVAMPKPYEYYPLDASSNEIRLLKLFPPRYKGDSVIRGELFHTKLEEDTFYGVSYAWDDPALTNYPPVSMCCLHLSSGTQLHLQRNLTALLLVLRESEGLRSLPIWVDAICINQKDVVERSREVTRMSEIYPAAKGVLAWLGPEEYDSNLTIFLAASILEIYCLIPDEAWNEIRRDLITKDYVLHWRAADFLFKRRLWARTWICQEITLAKKLTFLCGTMSLSRESAIMLAHTMWTNSIPLSRFMGSHGFEISVSNVAVAAAMLEGLLFEQPDLLAVIAFTRTLSCTDEKDHVYGVLGMAIDSKTIIPKPDYSLSFSDIRRNLAEAVTKARGSLDYLSLLDPRPDHLGPPPWVFSTKITTEGKIYMNRGLREPIKHSVCHAARNTSPIVTFDSDKQSITLEGYIVDGIDGLCVSSFRPGDETAIQLHFQSNNSKNQYFSTSPDMDTFNVLWMTLCITAPVPDEDFDPQFEAYGEAFGAFWLALEEDPTLLDKWIEPHPDDYFFARWYVWSRTFLVGGRPLSSWIQSACAGNVPQLKQPLNHPYWRKLQRCIRDVSRLATTDSGYLAMVPPSSQPGDLICVMFGGRFPLVLRPVNGGYHLIGDAYVHGIMNGETLLDYEKGAYTKQVFNLI
jgi:hypothetical protein